MAEGRGRDAWGRASLIAALIANANRDSRRRKPLPLDFFNPYVQKAHDNVTAVTPETMGKFRRAFGQPERKQHR